jgi:hypothetical protein
MHLVTLRLMTVTDSLQVVLRACYELVVLNLLTNCFVQTIPDLLKQNVANLLASSTLLQHGNNLFQTYQQLVQQAV